MRHVFSEVCLNDKKPPNRGVAQRFRGLQLIEVPVRIRIRIRIRIRRGFYGNNCKQRVSIMRAFANTFAVFIGM